METNPSHVMNRWNQAFIAVPATWLLGDPGQLASSIHTSATICNMLFPHHKKLFETSVGKQMC